MKKTILVLTVLLSAFISSCNKNDEPTQDPVIGTWYLESIEGEPELNDCQKTSTAVFTGNTCTFTWFRDDDGDSACLQEDQTNFTWVNLGNNIYELAETVVGADTFQATIVFEGDNMTISTDDGDFVGVYSKN